MDTSMTALTKSINDIGTAFEEFKKVNDERINAEGRAATRLPKNSARS